VSRLLVACACALAVALPGCGEGAKTAVSARAPVVAVLGDGGPVVLSIGPPQSVRRSGGRRLAEFKEGSTVTAQSGCLACHRIGDQGNGGPGPNLTRVGSRLSHSRIERALIDTTEPMPSFGHLPKAKLHALVAFLSLLRG